MLFCVQALKSYSVALLLDGRLKQKVFINRGLLYFQMEDYNNALLDFYDAFKVNRQGTRALSHGHLGKSLLNIYPG